MPNRLWALYREPFRKYRVFTGRSTRGEFWTFTLVNVLVMQAFLAVDTTVGWYSRTYELGVLSALFSLALFVPSLAVTVRRLHDSGLDGAWLLVIFVPLIGWLAHLYHLLRASTPGENRFGPDSWGGRFEVQIPEDGGAPYAHVRGRFLVCPWCRKTNPPELETCQWCHKPFRRAG